jgi:hypothetical protein
MYDGGAQRRAMHYTLCKRAFLEASRQLASKASISVRSSSLEISQKEPTRCNRVVEFAIPKFLNCSACFGGHTTHHQELKNINFSLWVCISKTYVKAEAAITVFELLMMGGVSPETC